MALYQTEHLQRRDGIPGDCGHCGDDGGCDEQKCQAAVFDAETFEEERKNEVGDKDGEKGKDAGADERVANERFDLAKFFLFGEDRDELKEGDGDDGKWYADDADDGGEWHHCAQLFHRYILRDDPQSDEHVDDIAESLGAKEQDGVPPQVTQFCVYSVHQLH